MNRRAFLQFPLKSESASIAQMQTFEAPIQSISSAGYPRDYVRHKPIFVEDAHVWLVRDELGFYAIDAVCPHLGGLLRPVEIGFICPCHRSIFSPNGDVQSGPARRYLRYFRVDLGSDGRLIIQRDQIVSPDDRFIA